MKRNLHKIWVLCERTLNWLWKRKKNLIEICSFFFLCRITCIRIGTFHTKSSENGNVSISILSFTPTREDNGKVLMCRAINEVMKHSAKETTLKLNIYCKCLKDLRLVFSFIGSIGKIGKWEILENRHDRLYSHWLQLTLNQMQITCSCFGLQFYLLYTRLPAKCVQHVC